MRTNARHMYDLYIEAMYSNIYIDIDIQCVNND